MPDVYSVRRSAALRDLSIERVRSASSEFQQRALAARSGLTSPGAQTASASSTAES